jgi:hypothetical protein
MEESATVSRTPWPKIKHDKPDGRCWKWRTDRNLLSAIEIRSSALVAGTTSDQTLGTGC